MRRNLNCGARDRCRNRQCSDFRCPDCNGLLRSHLSLEPQCAAYSRPLQRQPIPPPPFACPNPNGALRYNWQERRTSTMAVDQSGVWRFRELLPIVSQPGQRRHPRARATPRSTRCPAAPKSPEASTGCSPSIPGHEPHRLLQGHRHDRRHVRRRRARLQVGGLRLHRHHFSLPGRLRRARAPACAPSSLSPRATKSPGASSRSPWTTAP